MTSSTDLQVLQTATTISHIQDLQDWLSEKAQVHKLKFLLAHADDGVIWGHFNEVGLTTADQFFPHLPQLRLSTLQQCRIFGQSGEVLLWRSDDKWKYRFIGAPSPNYFDELQMLWGTHAEGVAGGFTLVADGSEGLRHAVPLTNIPFSQDRTNRVRSLRLLVRHYIDYDCNGIAHIHLSRLVDVMALS
jgi:CRISPR-associated protein (TIGR03984 family)